MTYTVIMATYNAGNKLRHTAESVVSQNVDLELLIIDAASTDGSLHDAVHLVTAHRDRVRLTSEADKGVYDAMNKGVEQARGRYLFFIGAGDTLRPNILEKIADALPEDDRGVVYGNVIRDGKSYDGPFSRSMLVNRNICHQAIFYGRDTFRKHGKYELKYRYLADWEYNLRLWGDRHLNRKWVDAIITDYEGGGVSDSHFDAAFSAARKRLILRHFGIVWCARHYRKPIAEKASAAIKWPFRGAKIG